MKPTTFSPCSATMPIQLRWRRQRRKSSSVQEYSKLSCSVCSTSGMSRRIIQRICTRTCSFSVRLLLIPDSPLLPLATARGTPSMEAQRSRDTCRSRSECDRRDAEKGPTAGAEEGWSVEPLTSSDLNNFRVAAQDQGTPHTRRACLVPWSCPRRMTTCKGAWLEGAKVGESFPRRTAVVAVITRGSNSQPFRWDSTPYRLAHRFANKSFPKVYSRGTS